VIAAPRVLLVVHDASRTGAPLCALAWTRWAERTGAAQVEVALDRGGPLVDRFGAVARTQVRSAPARRILAGADAILGPPSARRVRRALGAAQQRTGRRVDVVVAASTAAWRSAVALAPRGGVVLWVHELDGVADRIVSPIERPALLEHTRSIVAVSERVAAMVVDRWGVEADRVTVVPSFVEDPGAAADRRGAHGGTTAPKIVAVGSLVPRKGAEHLVALVGLLRRGRPDLTAAWVGGDLTTPYADLIATDIADAGLGEAVTLVGAVDDVEPWWPTDGVVVHLAREDPAPLVAIEAAIRSIPVVTWDTGGAADLVRAADLGALVAAPGDLVAVAEAVAGLLDDASARRSAGSALRDAAAGRTTDRLAPALLEAFTKVAR
jgi:glycosyltransferase involved in cell wall biosynthesis